ncbi:MULTISPECIES: metalloregulator ArsR/SmtB family transcription factor [Planococcaceae]|uniref:ArsR family transcriptional regulator n=1 Tax=Planococcus halotolerans TaxID=2233542 RepID=A0A365L7I4_9BACL|nr:MULTISPECIES: metalloregulator ArsR/SmtB family transcription factor [Planococcaceae]QHJ69910.1 metalloregulator ArsR/SmtB family transcription factor [Planococcus halotolerans]RAZ81396.1 ArsR family transcriptional regulator [Planococcus halotolerans]RLQ89846.1 ArsR family transcriptional regulator [Planomicrobium sp. Y74]
MEATVKEVEIEKAGMVLKLLGDKTRLAMMKLLEKNDCCVCEFVEIFQISQSAISQHLRKLRDVGLVKEQRRGQWIFYSLNKDSETYEMVLHILEFIPSQDERLKDLEKQGLRISCN